MAAIVADAVYKTFSLRDPGARDLGSRRPGPFPRSRYFRTVLGAKRPQLQSQFIGNPFFSPSDVFLGHRWTTEMSAIGRFSDVHRGSAIARISCWSSSGKTGGLPTDRDFLRQKRQNPLRCQRRGCRALRSPERYANRTTGLTTPRANVWHQSHDRASLDVPGTRRLFAKEEIFSRQRAQ
jgi:hypothetical protein